MSKHICASDQLCWLCGQLVTDSISQLITSLYHQAVRLESLVVFINVFCKQGTQMLVYFMFLLLNLWLSEGPVCMFFRISLESF